MPRRIVASDAEASWRAIAELTAGEPNVGRMVRMVANHLGIPLEEAEALAIDSEKRDWLRPRGAHRHAAGRRPPGGSQGIRGPGGDST
jgi:hypothetical protein